MKRTIEAAKKEAKKECYRYYGNMYATVYRTEKGYDWVPGDYFEYQGYPRVAIVGARELEG